MLNERSFSEILEELKPTENTGIDFSAGWESHQDAWGMAQIIGHVHLVKPLVTKAYAKTIVQKKYPFKSQPKPVVVRPSHLLNADQLTALSMLATYSPQIKDNFNLHELKSAYRLSVLKTHPDQGGNGETFQEVKKSYQILMALVKN